MGAWSHCARTSELGLTDLSQRDVASVDYDLAEPLTETIDVQAAHEPRHPSALFTADQAAPVFMHYVEHQTVPDGYTLRLVADL
jgi:hypothetical protein